MVLYQSSLTSSRLLAGRQKYGARKVLQRGIEREFSYLFKKCQFIAYLITKCGETKANFKPTMFRSIHTVLLKNIPFRKWSTTFDLKVQISEKGKRTFSYFERFKTSSRLLTTNVAY